MKVAIIGGAGFIGRSLARALISRGDKVIVLDDLSVRPEEELPWGVTFVKGSAASAIHIRDVLSLEPDVVCCFAAKQGYHTNWSRYARSNVLPAYVLFEVMQRKNFSPQKIILASSQAVYAPGLDVSEHWDCIPFSVYGMTKLQQEQVFEHFCRPGTSPIVALRYSIVLGAGQSLQSSESGVLRNWIRDVAKGKAPKIYGDGTQIRDFVHVKDVTAANLLAIDRTPEYRFEAVNIGGYQATIERLATCFSEVAGGPSPVVLNRPIRPGGEFTLTSSSARALSLFGWEPTLGLSSMVGEFVDFARKRLASRRLVGENEAS